MDCMVVREGDVCCELATVSSLNAGLHAFWSRRKASSGLLVGAQKAYAERDAANMMGLREQ